MRRRVVRQLTGGAATAVAVLCAAEVARADQCTSSDVVYTLPRDGATDVPSNATLVAQYPPDTAYVDETVTFDGPNPGGSDIPIDPVPSCADLSPGNFCFSDSEALLKVMPPGDLAFGGTYTIKWPGLRGLTASKGRGKTVTFTVGSHADGAPPTFQGLKDVSWDVDRSKDDCTNQQVDRFAFDLVPGAATDDFGKELLTLVVDQTLGPKIPASAPPVQIARLELPAAAEPARVELSLDDASGDVCFAAFVLDLVNGHAPSNGNDKQVCTTTTRPPFFYGCGVAPLRAPGRAAPFALLLLSLAWRRRHRSTS